MNDLVDACQRLVEALAGSDDVQPVVDAVALLEHPQRDVVVHLAAMVVALAEGRDDELAGLTSRRLPETGEVARIVAVLRGDDAGAVERLRGEDPVPAYVTLAAAAACLIPG